MSDMPSLCDRDALRRNRARARKMGAELFLQREAAFELQERLGMVNRTFTAPAVVTAFPEIWAEILPQARLVADEERLALEPEAHDLVIHAMCLQWANDPVGQMIQCRRALKSDGLFLGVMPGGQTLNELRTSLAEAESALSGGLSPRVLPMGEIRDLGGLIGRAGLALPVADSVPLTASYRDLRHLARDLRAMGEGNALTARSRRGGRALFERAGEIYSQHFPAQGGRITATFDLIVLTGWAPDPSQQKPLRPGSAAVRLADALKAAMPDKTH